MANKISKSTAYIVDLLCEGEIEGPANSTWPKSTYFNETAVQNSDGSYNFDGTTVIGRTGTATDANYLNDFNTGDTLQTETIVNVELTYAGGEISRSITDDEVDHVAVTFSFPQGLVVAYDSGKQRGLSVKYKITVTPDGGYEREAKEGTIEKRAYSEFRNQVIISNLTSSYGAGPWTIKCYRMTEDRTSSSEAAYNDQMNWYSFTEIKEIKLQYRNRAVVATQLLAEDFGDNIPNRAWKIKGLKIKYPSNYDPSIRTYSGVWNGTFTTGYCNNPAWVMYDLLINKRYGLGIDKDRVDKWTLYTIGQYCDGDVTYNIDTRQSNGSYNQTEVIQPRFTFNGVISDREQALAVVNHFCSVFRGFPMWSTGLVTFGQDSPGDVTRIASPANVIDGLFEYEGTSKRQRTTAVKVGWNDPENFGKRDTIVLEDRDGIVNYGYNPFDFFAIGCNNRNEAILRGKYALYTNINQTEICNFRGGIEWADALPGDIIGIQDPDYAGENWSGRVVSSTTQSITIDHPVTIAGATYTLYIQQNTDDVTTRTLTNSPGSTSTLTWVTPLSAAPQAGNVWVVSSTSLAIRKFRILSVKENEKYEYQITSYEYDPNKYSLVENNLYIETPIPTTQPLGELDPPSNLTAEAYSWVDGDTGNRKYGINLSWTASPDVRTQYYEIKYTKDDGRRLDLDVTGDVSYDWNDVLDGTYDFYLRSRSLTGYSQWITYADFVMAVGVGTIAPPTNVQVKGGGYTWGGKDCTIEWTGVNEGTYNGNTVTKGVVRNYKVEVYDTDTLSLRRTYFTASTEETEYTYFYADNVDDGNGNPERDLTFKVYSVSWYAALSNAATQAVSNPAPDMSSSTPTVTAKPSYLKVTWTPVSDIDMAYYKIYLDTSNPPTTYVGTVYHPNALIEVFGLNYGTDYYVQVEPYDGFGPGNKSVIPAAVSPLLIPGINVDTELTNSITMSDSDSNTAETLAKLYDRNHSTDGVEYILSGTDKYIQYQYEIENYFDRVGVWCSSASTRVYISYSDDGSTWSYLKAEADHTLTSNGELVAATNQSDAQTNYWQLAAGINIALFPDNITAKYVRLYLRGTYTTTIYEFIPSRILISELAAIESLSAISADIGTVTAGNLQSSDYGASAGINIDLDAKTVNLGGSSAPVLKFYNDGSNKLEINAKVTFADNSSGYANITDRPTTLDEIEAAAASKLDGIESGADVTATHTAASITGQGALATKSTIGTGDVDTTIISGGKIVTGLLTASNIQTGTLNASLVNVTNLNASNITTGALSANFIKSGTLNATNVSVINLSASNITAGTLSVGRIANGTLSYLKLAVGAATDVSSASFSASYASAYVTTGGSDKILITASVRGPLGYMQNITDSEGTVLGTTPVAGTGTFYIRRGSSLSSPIIGSFTTVGYGGNQTLGTGACTDVPGYGEGAAAYYIVTSDFASTAWISIVCCRR